MFLFTPCAEISQHKKTTQFALAVLPFAVFYSCPILCDTLALSQRHSSVQGRCAGRCSPSSLARHSHEQPSTTRRKIRHHCVEREACLWAWAQAKTKVELLGKMRVALLLGIEMSFFGVSRFFDLLFGIEIFFDLHFTGCRGPKKHGQFLIPGRGRYRCWTTEYRISMPKKRSRYQKGDSGRLDTRKKTSRYQKKTHP